MADNIELPTGSGGATVATDDDGTAHHQYVKVEFGADDTQTKVTSSVGLPVSLLAGTAAIGKLAANSGVDIGDVDVTSVIPGTGPTNLGKALDSVVGATDTGIALLGKHNSDVAHLTTAEGDYDILRIANLGGLQVSPEQHHCVDTMNATTGWAALGNDTLNLATTLKHVQGTAALTFDKVNGAANTVFAGIGKTLSSFDLGNPSPHDLFMTTIYIPDLTDVSYVFLRVGTDSTNYNEWRVDDTDLTAATFETLAFSVGDVNYAGITGNGWNPGAITYVAVGVAFDAETNTLAGIVFDEISFHTNQHTVANLNSEISSSVSSANVNLQKVGGSATDKGAGNVSNGSQRVVLASDQNFVSLEDTAHTTGDAGIMPLAVRNDDLAALAGTDGDYAPLQVTQNGALLVCPSANDDYKFAIIDAASSGDNTIQAAAGAGVKIRVLAAFLVSAGTVNARFESGASGTALTGQMNLVVNSGFTLPFNPAGWFETAANTLLNLELSAAVSVDGCITYIEVE